MPESPATNIFYVHFAKMFMYNDTKESIDCKIWVSNSWPNSTYPLSMFFHENQQTTILKFPSPNLHVQS